MSSQETARLIAWLEKAGHTDHQVVSCIKYVTTGIPPDARDEQQETQPDEPG